MRQYFEELQDLKEVKGIEFIENSNKLKILLEVITVTKYGSKLEAEHNLDNVNMTISKLLSSEVTVTYDYSIMITNTKTTKLIRKVNGKVKPNSFLHYFDIELNIVDRAF